MPRYVNPLEPASDAPPRIGVLLVNTGTPSDPTPRGVRRFLAEMLSDPRLVEMPRALWLPILYGLVLPLRPRRSVHAYRQIWTADGSPQLVIAQRLVQQLRTVLDRQLEGLTAVELGMNYGEPSIAAALGRLSGTGAQRIVVLPLFPQYAGVTTGSTFDRVSAELNRWRWVPELRFISDYADAPEYIEALKQSVLEHWRRHKRPQHLLMSFHGMPQSYFRQGDPYQRRCRQTAQLLAEALGLRAGEWSVSFQSRFGFQEWLRPYTDDAISQLASRGVKYLGVICPGFAVDCLESLEEIAIRAHAQFAQLGGESFDYIPALNERADHVALLAGLVMQHCAGWLEGSSASIAVDGRAPRLGAVG